MHDAGHPGTAAVVARRLAGVVLLCTGPLAGCGNGAVRSPAVLQVLVGAGRSDNVATGFALGPGRIVTVAHVLGERRVGDDVGVRPPGPQSVPRPARIITIDRGDDLAILAVSGVEGSPPPVGGITGDGVLMAIRGGRLRAVPVRVLRSIVAIIPAPDPRMRLHRRALQLRGVVRPGDSGAPVLRADGSVAGILFARSVRSPGIAYAVDAHALAPFLRQRSGR